jgi:hypothetical protein
MSVEGEIPNTGDQLLVYVHTNDRLQIEGYVRLSAASDRSRLSDLMNDSRGFIPIVDAKLYKSDGKLLMKSSFLCINKQNITLVAEAPSATSTNKETEELLNANNHKSWR